MLEIISRVDNLPPGMKKKVATSAVIMSHDKIMHVSHDNKRMSSLESWQ